LPASIVAGSTAGASAGWLAPALLVLGLALRRRRGALLS
jgi:MYXO-CTERM domain-containing protein